MSTARRRTSMLGILAALIVGTAAADAAPGVPIILTTSEETPGQPSYAQLAGGEVSADGGWVAFDFPPGPHAAPLLGFNLLQFVDAAAVDCPLTVQMKEWWYAEDLETAGGPWGSLPGDPNFRTPIQAQWDGLGAVPVYFVRETELLEAMADDVVTVAELETLPSLRIGRATHYQFNQHNTERRNASQTKRPGHTLTVAQGVLDDGQRFQFVLTTRDNEVTSIKIDFE